MGTNRKKHSPEFRAEAVRLVHEQGRTVADVARSHVHVNTLHGWVKAEAEGPAPAVRRRSPEQAEITRLRRELKRVTEERDILKRAAEFFASQRRSATRS